MISPRAAHHPHGPFSGRFREWSGVWSGVFHPGPGLGPGSLLNDSKHFRGFGVFRRVSHCRAERAPREPRARDLTEQTSRLLRPARAAAGAAAASGVMASADASSRASPWGECAAASRRIAPGAPHRWFGDHRSGAMRLPRTSLYMISIKNPGTPERIEIPRYLPRTEPRTGGVNPGPDPGPSSTTRKL